MVLEIEIKRDMEDKQEGSYKKKKKLCKSRLYTNTPLYCGSVFVSFSVRPINFDIACIFAISWHCL